MNSPPPTSRHWPRLIWPGRRPNPPKAAPQDITPLACELLGVDPPKIVYDSECPWSAGETRITMRILDESPIANVVAEWELNEVFDSRPMEPIDDQTFTVVLGPYQAYGDLSVTISAEDAMGDPAKIGLIIIKVRYCIG